MSKLLLYSTNVFLKPFIQEKYRGDVHYVWCSEEFDSSKLHRYAPGALVPPSSNPADIYRELMRDVTRKDSHSAKIKEQKATLIRLATEWEIAGTINTDAKDEIVYMVNNASFEYWRPLIYVIPQASVATRMKIVPIDKRAGFGVEYIVDDLKRTEFDMIEIEL